MELKGKKINFLGDSITQGVGVDSPEKIYLNVLKEKCGLAEARNYGISATRIARQSCYMTENLPAFCDRFHEMDDDADVVVVFGGTNDYGHGDANLGDFTESAENTFYGALHVLMRGLLEKYPTSEIVFMTPLHRCGDRRPCGANNSANPEPLGTYVEVIKEVAKSYGIPVLDLYSTSGIVPDLEISKKTFCPDGLHPNAEGHKRIASRLEGFLKSL